MNYVQSLVGYMTLTCWISMSIPSPICSPCWLPHQSSNLLSAKQLKAAWVLRAFKYWPQISALSLHQGYQGDHIARENRGGIFSSGQDASSDFHGDWVCHSLPECSKDPAMLTIFLSNAIGDSTKYPTTCISSWLPALKPRDKTKNTWKQGTTETQRHDVFEFVVAWCFAWWLWMFIFQVISLHWTSSFSEIWSPWWPTACSRITKLYTGKTKSTFWA